jgi:conjugative transfer region protein TrbK
MVSFKIVIRGVAYVVLAVALLVTAIALNNRQYQQPGILDSAPSPAADDFDAELAHCKALGTEAANDANCKAAWQSSRERFFNGSKPYQDRAPVALPPASNKPAGGRVSSPSDRAGHAQ